jgi:hypothetical protein
MDLPRSYPAQPHIPISRGATLLGRPKKGATRVPLPVYTPRRRFFFFLPGTPIVYLGRLYSPAGETIGSVTSERQWDPAGGNPGCWNSRTALRLL